MGKAQEIQDAYNSGRTPQESAWQVENVIGGGPLHYLKNKFWDDETARHVVNVLVRWTIFKWTIILILIIYMVVMVVKYFATHTSAVDEAKREKLAFLHHIMFGGHGIMLYIFIGVLTTIIILMLLPLVLHVKEKFIPSADHPVTTNR